MQSRSHTRNDTSRFSNRCHENRFQVMLHVVSLEPSGVIKSCVSPTVHCRHVDTTLLNEKLDAVKMALGRRQVECRSTIVVTGAHVVVGQGH